MTVSAVAGIIEGKIEGIIAQSSNVSSVLSAYRVASSGVAGNGAASNGAASNGAASNGAASNGAANFPINISGVHGALHAMMLAIFREGGGGKILRGLPLRLFLLSFRQNVMRRN